MSAMCRYSRYLFLVPLVDKTSKAVCKAIQSILDRVGRFPIVKSDSGGEFNSSPQLMNYMV